MTQSGSPPGCRRKANMGNIPESTTFTISIPADNDGYVLMKCPQCGELFRLKVRDIHDEGVLNIHCPACGFASYSRSDFITDDVRKYAETVASNYAGELVNSMMKDLEKSLKGNKFVKVKSTSIIKEETPTPIRSVIDTLKPSCCSYCGKYSKIRPLLRNSAYTCPLCGVKNFGL